MNGSTTQRVAAVVLARDRHVPLQATLDAILAQKPAVDVLVLVDNDGTAEVSRVMEEAARRHSDAEVLHLAEHLGCAGGFEAGLARIVERGDIDVICAFDDDATPLPGCVEALTAAIERLPDAGVVGAVSHTPDGTLAWPMHIVGEREPVRTVDEVHAAAARRGTLPVVNVAWHGLTIPVEVIRRHGNVWGDLFLQYEDIELGLRLARAGLRVYLAPDAECLHPAPPDARDLRILGREIQITAQNGAKEYLTLRNGLVVRSRYDGVRFWYGTGPLILLRGLLSALALDAPAQVTLRHVFARGVIDAIRGRLGPAPAATAAIGRTPPAPPSPSDPRR